MRNILLRCSNLQSQFSIRHTTHDTRHTTRHRRPVPQPFWLLAGGWLLHVTITMHVALVMASMSVAFLRFSCFFSLSADLPRPLPLPQKYRNLLFRWHICLSASFYGHYLCQVQRHRYLVDFPM